MWLITAGGATFAAFPGWYASMFAGFYLALFLILVALILCGISFEFWGKSDTPRWRATWEWVTVASSGAAALLWGVAWANIVHGVPMNARHEVTATIWDLLHPYALPGGLVSAARSSCRCACAASLWSAPARSPGPRRRWRRCSRSPS